MSGLRRSSTEPQRGTVITEYSLILTILVIGIVGIRTALMSSLQNRDAQLSQSVKSNYPLPLSIIEINVAPYTTP